MSKAFTREDDNVDDDDLDLPEPALPKGTRNYLTPQGYARLRDELTHLMTVERPGVVQVVSWAASNGDRSENGDYLYGKKRLREIDRRMRFLTRRLEIAEVVDPRDQLGQEQIFFGATVRYLDDDGHEQRIKIVGVDEAEPLQQRISWVSPVARALTRARPGDVVTLRTPAGEQSLEILEVDYTEADPAPPRADA
ncbi:MAG: transcription elongation factor GreB [Pigmentiphaga sp.]